MREYVCVRVCVAGRVCLSVIRAPVGRQFRLSSHFKDANFTRHLQKGNSEFKYDVDAGN